jgi:hypothetical protein
MCAARTGTPMPTGSAPIAAPIRRRLRGQAGAKQQVVIINITPAIMMLPPETEVISVDSEITAPVTVG